MKKYSNIIIIVSIILAIILGLFLPSVIENISFIGTIYINLLKFMIFPIISTTIIITIYNTKKSNNKLILKTVLLFLIMFVLSFLLTSLIVYIINPASNYSYNFIEWSGSVTNIDFKDVLINLFPSNIISAISNNSLFSIIIISCLIGSVASKVENGEYVIKVIDGFKNISYKILEYIMFLTPLAIISLLGSAISNYGSLIFDIGGKYILIAYLCSLIVMMLVMILPVWIICKINPITYIKKISKVWIISITTCSSVATLPTTIRVCNKDLGVKESITNITVPLGCTIHMCGGAVSFALLGIFCSQLFGVDITITKYIIMIISATLINMAAPGIPNGGIVIGASFLSLLNIPLSFIGFYSSIYKLLDMSYTTLNVTGDISANVILNKFLTTKKL